MLCGIRLEYYFICWVGAFVLYYRLLTDGKQVLVFIPHINKKWSLYPAARILDAILFSAAGSFIGTVMTQPTNPQQAIAAGLGWTGLLSTAGDWRKTDARRRTSNT